MIPDKLKPGDEVRVIAPARSMAAISKEAVDIAKKRFEDMGLKVSFSKNSEEKDGFNSSSIKSRVEDIHEAFSDKNVKAVITIIGGFNSNQLLKYIDFKIIKKNPKIFCGYSDITTLNNAFFAKAGLVNYYGPHFSNFGMLKGPEYTLEYFKKCLFSNEPFEVFPSEKWSDDQWYKDQKKRNFVKNNGYLVINEGKAKGTVIGGNQVTLQHLAGTPFFPQIRNSIIFLEDDHEEQPHHFDSTLTALTLIPDFEKVKAVVIGRFQKASDMADEKLIKIIKTKKEFDTIPVIAGVDFGHTTPQITFPVGGRIRLVAEKDKIELKIIKH